MTANEMFEKLGYTLDHEESNESYISYENLDKEMYIDIYLSPKCVEVYHTDDFFPCGITIEEMEAAMQCIKENT